ncbi:MAG: hypothetical protein KME59_19695 [Trichormus sp. ATA11-4-KO1]|nr:hypothetical protein [Trichormus sp. ATA11-4-KO1]
MTRDDYEKQLRKIVLHSADIIPEKVAEYLQEVAKYGYAGTKRQILKEYKPLADHIPKAFVDFALDIFIKIPRKRRLLPLVTSDNSVEAEDSKLKKNLHSYLFQEIIPDDDYEPFDFSKLKIEDFNDFLAPAHVQGPFLYLLQKNEDEGLRLVQTLTNFAVAKWREREQKPQYDESGIIPLPVIIDLPSGAHEFWGNADIYCWYRGTSVGPYPVISALMALEVWMERQIEAGRNVEELFEKILLGSNCVAVLGICLGITLAYPDKCLRAAIPIISSPAVWEMDISRWVNDRSNSWKFVQGFERPSVQWIYELIEERNKRPQRSLEARHLAQLYILANDESLRFPVEEAIAKFTENLPFFYQDETENAEAIAIIRERMENYQAYGNRANYRIKDIGDQQMIWVEPPEDVRKRNEVELNPNSKLQSWLGLCMWAQKTIEQGTAADNMTIEQAVASVKELQQAEDFSLPYENTEQITRRLEAIASVAAAILITDFEWAQTQNLVAWSRDILIAAARMPDANQPHLISFHPKVSAGRGLGMLIAHDAADIEVRQQVLLLLGDEQEEVVKAVFCSLYQAWEVDEILCWNALSLILSLCLIPANIAFGRYVGNFDTNFDEKEKWQKTLIANHLDNLNQNQFPVIPKVPSVKEIIFSQKLATIFLYALPIPELFKNPTAKQIILQLTDDLIAWTVEANTLEDENRRYHDRPPFEWNYSFFRWASYVMRSLSYEEARQHILNPVRNCWSKAPRITTDLLDGYIEYHIAYLEPLTTEAILGWREICNWVLDSSEIARWANNAYLSNDMSDTVSRILFVQLGKCWFKEEWSHAALFSDIIEKWVKVIGHNPQAFSYLITMLSSSGWQFAPEPTLEWLTQCVNASTHPLWQERDNSERTAELLQRIWNNFEKQIRDRTATLQRYSDLVYRLVDAGVPLAGLLRQKLEQRSK